MGPTVEMQTYAARLETFEQTHQIAKRRTSNTRKAKQSVEWPHNNPTGVELARAGFFYRPAQDSTDNVQCFVCSVKLDGWEPTDSPLLEHIAHSSNCAWAAALSVARDPDSLPSQEPETRDPLCDELTAARQATFDVGKGWPHESKKGWKCKSDKLVAAGWVFDPSPDADDGVTCFYCGLSLDGWEPKDNPFEEHQRRSTGCPFFELAEQYSSFRASAKGSKTKAKGGKVRGRASSASRQSGISQTSVRFSDTLSVSGTEVDAATVDDSIMTAGTTSSKMSGRPKKGTKPKAAPKRAKIKKTIKAQDESTMEVEYPDLNFEASAQEVQEEKAEPESVMEEQINAPTKSTKSRGARNSKQVVDSSALDTSASSELPSKEGIRGRKPIQQPESEPAPEDETIDVSLQLQQELERSTFSEASIADAEAESTPQPQQKNAAKRGIKRASDGARKEHIETSIVSMEFPLPPKPATYTSIMEPGKSDGSMQDAYEHNTTVSLQLQGLNEEESITQQSDLEMKSARPTRGRPKKKVANSTRHENEYSGISAEGDASQEAPNQKAATKKGRGRPKKASATISLGEPPMSQQTLVKDEVGSTAKAETGVSKSKKNTKAKKGSKTSNTSFMEAVPISESLQALDDNHAEDSDQDEREIQAELMRIAAEQEAQHKQEREQSEAFEVLEMEAEAEFEDENVHEVSAGTEASSNEAPDNEFEPTPSRRESKHSRRDSGSSWQEAETSTPRMAGQPPQTIAAKLADATPSPAGSDKENLPSSIAAPQTAVKAQPVLSPTKTFRIPLAPGTPNRSPSRIPMLSPLKQQFSALSSTQPWEAVDLDTILLTTTTSSDEASPGKVGNALAQAAGMLTSPEKKMSVEEWIRWRAGKGEEDLRRRCESLVGVFEREGNKALGCLEGIVVQS